MARRRNTGDGEAYSDADEAALADMLADELAELDEDEDEATGTVNVEAQVEWAGTVDQNGRDGVRLTRLDGVELAGVRQAAARLREAARSGPDQPYKSYRAKGWRAQLRQMLSTKRGREAAEQAGLKPGTVHRWQGRTQAPSRASRAKISGAYDRLRDPRPAAVAQARHELAETFTRALSDRYGVTVRLRDIHHLWFEQ